MKGGLQRPGPRALRSDRIALRHVGSMALASARGNGWSPAESYGDAAICVTQRYAAAPARVFDAWLDPVVAGRWLFATASRPIAQAEIDARVGGSFRFVDRHGGEVVEYAGQYLEIVPYRRLAFSLALEPRRRVDSRVSVIITPQKRGCVLTLRHEDVPPDHADDREGRWAGILYGLGEMLAATPTTFVRDQE